MYIAAINNDRPPIIGRFNYSFQPNHYLFLAIFIIKPINSSNNAQKVRNSWPITNLFRLSKRFEILLNIQDLVLVSDWWFTIKQYRTGNFKTHKSILRACTSRIRPLWVFLAPLSILVLTLPVISSLTVKTVFKCYTRPTK